ncbi:MAG: hypothetical protein ACLQDM_22270 [Bradyrhizobium sp.]
MNIAAGIDTQSIAARFDVSIIWINPYVVGESSHVNRRENPNAMVVKYWWAASFSLSAPTASQLYSPWVA